MKKYILRFLGFCLGLAFAALGIFELTLMSSGDLNILNEITFIILGTFFILYGLTGRSSFFSETDNKEPHSNENE